MKRSSKFRPGDVVELASGGDPMTVLLCVAANTTVTWIAEGTPHTETYPTLCLRRREQRLKPTLTAKRWDVV